MATGINLGPGAQPLRAGSAPDLRARMLGRLRPWLAALLVGAACWTASPDAAAASGAHRTDVPRFQPGSDERPRPTPGPRFEANARSEKASVTVTVVYANLSGRFDPRLTDLRAQLESHGFTGAEVLTVQNAQLALDQSMTVNVEGGRKVQVTLREFDDAQARIRIELLVNGEKKLDTTVSIRNGKAFTVAGPKFREGKLLFPVSVQ